MALARLALRKLQPRVFSSAPNLAAHNNNSNGVLKRLMVTATNKACEEKKEGQEVAVSEGGKKSRHFPRKRGKRGLWNWRDDRHVPALWEIFPSGLGNALLQATENINRLFESMSLTPSSLMARVKEQDDSYKIRYDVPGLGKDDVKITVEDGVLTIKGELKEEEEQESEDGHWSAKGYGYYNAGFLLPEDTKVDDIKAELKDGVLTITIPRTEKPKKDVKEVQIQ